MGLMLLSVEIEGGRTEETLNKCSFFSGIAVEKIHLLPRI